MFVVVAKWYAKEEKIAQVKEILQTMMTASKSEPGCTMYIANQGFDDSRRFLIYEQYRDEAAFKEHLETPAFKESMFRVELHQCLRRGLGRFTRQLSDARVRRAMGLLLLETK
jgi:quinol monooxygenase YgiN